MPRDIIRSMKDTGIAAITTVPELKCSNIKDFRGDFFETGFLSICMYRLYNIVRYEVFFGTH